MEILDIAIIGCGVAGACAAYSLRHTKKTVALIDVGRPPLKRRRQMEGWLGLLPSSDGKLFLNDLKHCNFDKDIAFGKVQELLNQVSDFKVFESKKINNEFIKTAKSNNFSIDYLNWMQMYPKDIHSLSKLMNVEIENLENFYHYFDLEVSDVFHENGTFSIDCGEKVIKAKKVIIALGRSGWRLSHHIFNKFGLITDNTEARLGIKIETQSDNLKEFKKSILTLTNADENIMLGPFMSNGTVIPEDHIEMAQAAFRSNEPRWQSSFTTFDLIKTIKVEKACETVDRLSKLTWILGNDRIIKEPTITILNKKSKLFILDEYKFLTNELLKINSLFPEILEKSYYYAPLIMAEPGKIELNEHLETTVPGMYCIGESARIPGLLGAMISGMKMEQLGND